MRQPCILDLSLTDLTDLLSQLGEMPFRAKQLWEWTHAKRADSFEQMTTLSKSLREQLSSRYRLRTFMEADHAASADGLTEKWLLADDDKNTVETVLIREKRLTRRTVCASCMVGCPLGCVFCETGQSGFERNLTSGEILEQIYRVDRHCLDTESIDGDRAVSHVVFMGMGEPLLNFDAVLAAARVLADPTGLNLSGRHITLSTVGIPEGIRRLAAENVNFRLAISLHATDQHTREALLPVARKYPLSDLLDAIRAFSITASRDITFEYCLIKGVNDTDDDIKRLTKMLGNLSCKVNLIPLNRSSAYAGVPPSPAGVRSIQERLTQAGIPTTLRVEKGQDIAAACGQLRSRRKGLDTGPSPSL